METKEETKKAGKLLVCKSNSCPKEIQCCLLNAWLNENGYDYRWVL